MRLSDDAVTRSCISTPQVCQQASRAHTDAGSGSAAGGEGARAGPSLGAMEIPRREISVPNDRPLLPHASRIAARGRRAAVRLRGVRATDFEGAAPNRGLKAIRIPRICGGAAAPLPRARPVARLPRPRPRRPGTRHWGNMWLLSGERKGVCTRARACVRACGCVCGCECF